MADEAGVKPEDVDDLDDKAFEELKAGMMAAEEPQDDAEPSPEPPVEEQTEARSDRDEKGRFKKAEEQKAAEQDDDADDDLDVDPDDGKQRTVPHQRFHKERESRKEAERLRKEAEERFTKLADRLAQLTEAQQPKSAEPEAPEIPDPGTDPVGSIKWTVDTLRQQMEEQNRSKAEQEAASAEEQQWQRATAFAQQQFAQAEQADPELRPAYEHLLQSFQREAEAYGLQGPDLEQHLRNTEREHVRFALQNNMTIPEYVKRLATARGFTHKPAEPEQRQPDPVQQITEREEARKASLSLGKTGGGVSNTERITPERLLEMDDKEFSAFKEKYGSVGAVFN